MKPKDVPGWAQNWRSLARYRSKPAVATLFQANRQAFEVWLESDPEGQRIAGSVRDAAFRLMASQFSVGEVGTPQEVFGNEQDGREFIAELLTYGIRSGSVPSGDRRVTRMLGDDQEAAAQRIRRHSRRRPGEPNRSDLLLISAWTSPSFLDGDVPPLCAVSYERLADLMVRFGFPNATRDVVRKWVERLGLVRASFTLLPAVRAIRKKTSGKRRAPRRALRRAPG